MKKLKMTRNMRRNIYGFIFLSPFFIGFIMFFLIPIVRTFFYSFQSVSVGSNGGMEFTYNGLKNYFDLFKTEVTTDSKTLTELFANQNMDMLTAVPLITVFSLFMALLANKQFKGRAIVRMIFFLPIILGLSLVTDMLAMTTGSELTETGGGLFSESFVSVLLFNYTGIPLRILNPIMGYVDNIFDLISHAGVQTLIYLTALQSISPSLYEVARIEGATAYETFWKVTIPSIMHIIMFVVVYTIVELFLESQIAKEVYSFAFEQNKIGIGSALSVVYILNVLLVLAVVALILGKVVKRYE
ncbi:carbohydrate ABC transporter permease [Butyrivibrio sp. YAB3001]|uniref:carbohydrate ABC transporter permease n=1 Tax=Butyrivibrio sp. YAB3001 TaxID=1520812 RepID=UPI0008F66D45|nr:sugar ABC transporter permease [Butyrivibrio sp. YAB3001]SFC27102.1 ABC-type sugar transport system, permease component [Butyrivibrio sp. YAB3001]